MDKRERLDNTLLGRPVDRAPVALWRHFPGDDQRSADFARAVLSFQKTYDWDFVKVTPFSAYCVADYGVQTKWCGAKCQSNLPGLAQT
jgi:uroporphyrinogen decarboxylase